MLATRKVGDTLTLFTAPSGTELSSATISVAAGGRYTVEISSNTVTATVKTPSNFVHYDFAEGAGQASDTTYTHGDYTSYARNNARNGKALAVNSSSGTPCHSSNSAGKSPFHAGEMSILSLVKPYEADGTILWNLGQAAGDGIALVATDSSTLSLVSWTGGATGSNLVSVSGLDLTGKWHLAGVVADASGTTLYVDGLSASTDAVLPSGINQCGQFGSIHGNKKNYNSVTSLGFLLDDWRVYDAALTDVEVKELRKALNPPPFTLHLR